MSMNKDQVLRMLKRGTRIAYIPRGVSGVNRKRDSAPAFVLDLWMGKKMVSPYTSLDPFEALQELVKEGKVVQEKQELGVIVFKTVET